MPEPYADVYIKYLFAQIDFVNAEFARYNNSAAMYNTALSAYANFYRRTHLPPAAEPPEGEVRGCI